MVYCCINPVCRLKPHALSEKLKCFAETPRAKRKKNNLVKDGLSLLQSDEGIPCDEYKLLADMIREHLDTLQVTIDHVIKFKCEELKVVEYISEEDLDNAEQEIAMIEQAHFCEDQDNSMPIGVSMLLQSRRRGWFGDLEPKLRRRRKVELVDDLGVSGLDLGLDGVAGELIGHIFSFVRLSTALSTMVVWGWVGTSSPQNSGQSSSSTSSTAGGSFRFNKCGPSTISLRKIEEK
ncbi:hypothetical protein LOTGIDRAFT_167616 [Lottia gigantea]|uniref:Uncharacterized protein n=1 Tax=Lottia gigantea TaxID=225164 RepID=V3ZY35_LOTGI|nr:hypothetical protein LOTGIDRAFT_167616 [Lottia gigantea]ESO85866.1 hypothetical protein LOTGIDRAFT_167616 [Lottia gigantea]